MRSKRRAWQRSLAGAITVVLTAGMVAGTAHAAVEHGGVVAEQPSAATPHALNGSVDAFAQIGDIMFAGGTFTQVTDPNGDTTYPRRYLMAFDVSTGAILPWAPALNGAVQALEPSTDGTAVYASGRFTTANGYSVEHVVKFDISTGEPDPAFAPDLRHRRVSDLAMVRDRLVASGTFDQRMVALDPDTGADTGYLDLDITGVTGREGDGWWPDVYRFAVNPDQTKMVIIGNFSRVSGQQRRQIAVIDLGETATLSSWYSSRWNRRCHPALPWYTRDVDWSPDGSYFVVTTTGSTPPDTSALCTTASKWADTTDPRAEPEWVNHTGGNSLYSVAVTGAAVYVSGHPQWLDNPYGDKSAGPGAVHRPGIGAIDPDAGTALEWNPTRTRGHGAQVLYATDDGLWVGSDTERFNNQYRGRIAFVAAPSPDAPAE
jgi:hypothetical protein